MRAPDPRFQRLVARRLFFGLALMAVGVGWVFSAPAAGDELVHTYGHTHRNDSARTALSQRPEKAAPPHAPSVATTENEPIPPARPCAVALLVYGFVQALNPPVLCSIDLPTYKDEDPWGNTPEEDDTYYDVRCDRAVQRYNV